MAVATVMRMINTFDPVPKFIRRAEKAELGRKLMQYGEAVGRESAPGAEARGTGGFEACLTLNGASRYLRCGPARASGRPLGALPRERPFGPRPRPPRLRPPCACRHGS